VTLLDVVDEAKMLKQLRQVRRVLTEGATVDVCPYLKKGEMVRVVTGPFKGMEGLVSKIKGKTRVIINVDMIQQAVAVEVDADSLAPG
jgi:transcription antitermination factor NusG